MDFSRVLSFTGRLTWRYIFSRMSGFLIQHTLVLFMRIADGDGIDKTTKIRQTLNSFLNI